MTLTNHCDHSRSPWDNSKDDSILRWGYGSWYDFSYFVTTHSVRPNVNSFYIVHLPVLTLLYNFKFIVNIDDCQFKIDDFCGFHALSFSQQNVFILTVWYSHINFIFTVWCSDINIDRHLKPLTINALLKMSIEYKFCQLLSIWNITHAYLYTLR